MVQQDHQRVCIARIGAAHGVRGEVKLWPFTDDPMAVTRYGELRADDGRAFEIEAVRSGKDFLVARLKGIRDRSAAEQLRNVDLYVPRDRLPELADEEYYHADLIGLGVEDHDGTALGRVTAVHNFGAGDLLEIRPTGGGDTVMVPFTSETVPVIDITGGRIVLVAEGMLDIDVLLTRAKG
ncbi:MAG: ribosome maturation factor RimM [Bradyrhizobiaceae bacterium]|nr:ribosome maturation factor RimM [Bradyrhizobiaceae bacterium]